MPVDKETHHFYGRRKNRTVNGGRISVAEQCMLSEDILKEAVIDPAKILDQKILWLEVGFGKGEHLIGQAIKNPDVGFIGCEPFVNGAAHAAEQVVENGLSNVRIWQDDAVPLLSKFPDHCVDRLFLLFNDPWPKTRHYKRRFIQPHIVELLARLLKPGAQLRLATDDKSLAEWMLMHTANNPDFLWDNWQNGDWSTAPADWIETRYQQKAALQGRLAHYLDFTRQPLKA